MPAIIAKKIGMTQVFEEGRQVPVTLVQVLPNIIVAKTNNKVVIGAQVSKRFVKPIEGMLKKAGISEKLNKFKQFVWDGDAPEVGKPVGLAAFTPGITVQVTARGKGKGFAGTVKRHSFSRGPETHGSNNVRQPGSIGAQQPQRVVKGRKMGGHMGMRTVTVKNLKIVDVDTNQNIIAVSGSIPGANRSTLFLQTQTNS